MGSYKLIPTGVVVSLFIYISLNLCITPPLPSILYQNGDDIQVQVGSLVSSMTQIPYSYYSLPGTCQPDTQIKVHMGFGDEIMGNQWMNSIFKIKFQKFVHFDLLCNSDRLTIDQVTLIKELVENEYRVPWRTNNTTVLYGPSDYKTRIPIGFKGDEMDENNMMYIYYSQYLGSNYLSQFKKNEYYLNNHFKFVILYDMIEDGSSTKYSIKEVHLYPMSISIDSSYGVIVPGDSPTPISSLYNTSVQWTYSVSFEQTNSNWYNYQKSIDPWVDVKRIMSFSFANAIMVIVFLVIMVVIMFKRELDWDLLNISPSYDKENYPSLRKCLPNFNKNGWKLIFEDVLRAPERPLLLSSLVGNGIHLGLLGFLILYIGTFTNYFQVEGGGSIVISIIIGFIFTSIFGGYTTVSYYIAITNSSNNGHGIPLIKLIICNLFTFPSLAISIYTISNIILYLNQSSGYVKGSTFSLILLSWLVSGLVTFIGGYIAFKRKIQSTRKIDESVNLIRQDMISGTPRPIPTKPWCYRSPVLIPLWSVIPFGITFLQLEFLFRSMWIWNPYIYYGYFLVVMIFIIPMTCVPLSILMTYYCICLEDYNWWWQSFKISAFGGLYVLVMSFFFQFKFQLSPTLSSIIIYSGYSILVAVVFSLYIGSISFMASFYTINSIYRNRKWW